MDSSRRHPASFRDPAGYIFEKDGRLLRRVNQVYETDYKLLMNSGLYRSLVAARMLVPHEVIAEEFSGEPQWYTTLAPEKLAFISYPYEWCFSEWKRAALLTLDVLRMALDHGMVLKDATPFNVQFRGTEPIFIDTLSFEAYDASRPWVAYRQFIECFIAPMLLAKYRSPEMLGLFALYPEGIPLAQLTRLLPWKSRFNLNVFLHIVLPGMIVSNKGPEEQSPQHFSKQKLLNIVSNLRSWVHSLGLKKDSSHWSRYYDETILSDAYAHAKMDILRPWFARSTQQKVLDLGTNTGWFALAAADSGKQVIAADADHACIDALYNSCKKPLNLLALVQDITKPSPAIGWMNEERSSFLHRLRPGLTLALALVHHLAIGANISFDQLAQLLATVSEELIIEFVPKSDPKVQVLLSGRKDIFDQYDLPHFLASFQPLFTIISSQPAGDTGRILYYMQRR